MLDLIWLVIGTLGLLWVVGLELYCWRRDRQLPRDAHADDQTAEGWGL